MKVMDMNISDRKKKNIIELTRYSVAEYKAVEKLSLRVLTDNVRSMHNIGSIFRTSDAFRVEKIILGGISGCPPHPEISKTALGAEDSVDWIHVEDCVDEVKKLKEEGWKVCVLEQTHKSIPLHDFMPRKGDMKLLLVVGNEVHGVDQRIVDLADVVLEIPQEGTKHSLNVSTSAAIALYHLYLSVRPAS